MPRYYCDYCDTYLTHDSPSVRKQHNAGYKHKANVRTFYQQFEEQQTQSLIDQKVKEHLGQAAAVYQQQVNAAFQQHLGVLGQYKPPISLPLLPLPVPGSTTGSAGSSGSSLLPAMRPPVLPTPSTLSTAADYATPNGVPLLRTPTPASSSAGQSNGMPRLPSFAPPSGLPPPGSIRNPSFPGTTSEGTVPGSLVSYSNSQPQVIGAYNTQSYNRLPSDNSNLYSQQAPSSSYYPQRQASGSLALPPAYSQQPPGVVSSNLSGSQVNYGYGQSLTEPSYNSTAPPPGAPGLYRS